MVLRSGHLWRLSLLVVVTLVLAWTTPSASKSSSPLSLQQDYLDTFCTPLLASSNSAVIKERKKRIDVDSDESFVHAVNLTNSKRLQRYLQHHHIHSTHLLTEATSSIAQQPHKVDKHICLLTRLTPSIYSYAKNSYFVQSIYAHLHDYLFLPLYPDTAVEDYEFHRKLQPLLEALEDIQLPCDYILWMDADWIPIDLTMKLEDFIASSTTAGCSQHNEHSSSSETHVWISQDVSTLVNTGSILLRNTRWSRQLLRTWISMKNQDGVGNEQLGFEALYPTLSTSDRDKICILPSHVLNSISPPMKTLASSHQVMHLAAEDNVYRKAVLQEAAKALCESMQDMPVHSTSNSSSNHMEEVEGMQALLPLLPKQLGLTRNKLQLIAIDLYGQLQQEIQANITKTMQSSDGHVHIELLSRYRMVASKYCFALVYQHRNEEFALSLKMRWKAVQLYLQIVNQRYLSIVKQRQVLEVTSNIEEVLQRHPVETFLQQYRRLLQSSASSKDIWQRQFVEDMPELVKLTLEIAYEYVHISDDYFQESTNTASLQRNLCSRSELYNLIVFTLPQLLTVLLDVVHSSQVNIVQQMQADYQHFQQHQQLTASFHKLCTHLFSSSSEL